MHSANDSPPILSQPEIQSQTALQDYEDLLRKSLQTALKKSPMMLRSNRLAPNTAALLPRPNTIPQYEIIPSSKQTLPTKSPLNPDMFRELLVDYPQPEFPTLLAEIIQWGAKIGYQGPQQVKIRRPNHLSAYLHPQVIANDLAKDITENRLITLDKLPSERYYCSPLGLVPKKDSRGIQSGWRRIFDLSAPISSSVNDHIDESFGALSYTKFDAAISNIRRIGRGAVLMKRDLKSAFRHIPVAVEDHWLLLFEWEEKYYVDVFLPFGLRTAPFIFNLFAEAFEWILQRKYSWILTHYLDDFLVYFPLGTDINIPSNDFNNICEQLGFTVATDKNEDGCVVTYLGLELDTNKMEARLPEHKKHRALREVKLMLSNKSGITRKQLQSLLGFLTFCTRVFPLGRPFLRHLFNMLNSINHGKRRLTMSAKRDLKWWLTFLPLWSGISAIDPPRKKITIATDASGRKGIGGICYNTKEMFSTRIARSHRRKHINWKEMYAVLYAFAAWGSEWKGNRVEILCDNETVVAGINKRTIRGRAIEPLQQIFLIAGCHDIAVRATWIPTHENKIADALSRFDRKRLTNLVGVQLANSLCRRQHSILKSRISLLKQRSTYITALQSQLEER